MLNNNKKQETQFFGTKCGNANSIAAGYATETTNYGEIATGILNKSTKGDNPNGPEGVVGDPKATLFSVGCGTKEERKNALEVKGDGSVIVSRKDGSDVNIADLAEKLKEHSVDLSKCVKYGVQDSGSIAINYSAEASKYSVAVGVLAKARYNKAVAIGYGAEAEDADIAIGNNAIVNGKFCIAIGNSITLDKFLFYSTVIGYKASGNFTNSTALGANATALSGATALGAHAIASNDFAVAIGKNAKNNKSIFSVGFNGVNGIDMDKDNYGLYLKGFGGYTGKNLTINNEAGEEILNPNIKSVQQIINGKADITPIVTSTDATISLQPNKKYEITARDTLVLTFTEPSDKTHKNEYLFSINTGSSVSTITFPIEIIWDVEPVIAANKHYEINVQYSQGKYWGTVHTWNIPS